jgi:hypothetical protein
MHVAFMVSAGVTVLATAFLAYQARATANWNARP